MPIVNVTHQFTFLERVHSGGATSSNVQQSYCIELWDTFYVGSKYFILSERGQYKFPCSYNLESKFTLLGCHSLSRQ